MNSKLRAVCLLLIFILCVMFKRDFYEKDIDSQLALERYQPMVNPFPVAFKKSVFSNSVIIHTVIMQARRQFRGLQFLKYTQRQ